MIKRNKNGQFVKGMTYVRSPKHKRNHSAAFQRFSGPNHWNWKGNQVGYKSLHEWINNHFEKPEACEYCGTTKAKKFEWACREGNYTRERQDYIYLCCSCHKTYDGIVFNIKKMRK